MKINVKKLRSALRKLGKKHSKYMAGTTKRLAKLGKTKAKLKLPKTKIKIVKRTPRRVAPKKLPSILGQKSSFFK
jgi:hypothetical protein